MTTVESAVECPLCGGEATETFDCNSEAASYHCENCGYATDTEDGQSIAKARRQVPPVLRPFLKTTRFAEDGGGVYDLELTWWPGAMQLLTEYEVIAVVVKGGLVWRRTDIEEVPEDELLGHANNGGEACKYRYSKDKADYPTYAAAIAATHEENRVNSVAWKLKSLSPQPRLKHLPSKGGGKNGAIM